MIFNLFWHMDNLFTEISDGPHCYADVSSKTCWDCVAHRSVNVSLRICGSFCGQLEMTHSWQTIFVSETFDPFLFNFPFSKWSFTYLQKILLKRNARVRVRAGGYGQLKSSRVSKTAASSSSSSQEQYQAKFPISRHVVHTHRVMFYISNTLRKPIIMA